MTLLVMKLPPTERSCWFSSMEVGLLGHLRFPPLTTKALAMTQARILTESCFQFQETNKL